MEIHELNTYEGTLGAGAFLAIDNGADTGKISYDALVALLNERIDNIIAGPAPSAQEVTDARLGADEITYSSLGDAVRGQVALVRSEIVQTKNAYDFLLDSQIGTQGNLFDGQYQNRFVNAQSGAVTNYEPKALSSLNYIPITPGNAYIQNIPFGSVERSLWLYFYKSDKTFISYRYIGTIQTINQITVPANTAFMRFMVLASSANILAANADKQVLITRNPIQHTVMTANGAITSGNLNNVLTPGSFNISTDNIHNIQNVPSAEGGTLLCIKGFGGGSGHFTQIYFSADKSIYYRYLLEDGTAFISWAELVSKNPISNYIKRVIVTSDTAANTYNSLASNFPVNTEIACNKAWFTDLNEFPSGWYYIKTVATSQNAGDLSQRLQFAVSGLASSGVAVPSEIIVAVRYLVTESVYSDWITIYSQNARTPSYIAFGDSVCRGNYPDSTKSPYAWPEAFSRKQRIACLNKSIGGQGYLTTEYTEKAIDTIQATDITGANLITLAFGINDASDPNVTIGTINDTTENTVFGEVYRCINYIYSQNKKVQIVLCGTTRQNGSWSTRLAEINAKMKEFAAKYNLAFIDMTQSPINQFNGQANGALTSDGTHFNDDGYILLSQYMVGQLGTYFGN